VAEIKTVIAELPTYGYRRVHAILKRQALAAGLKPPNHKWVYRVTQVHGLLLDRHAGGVERRHDGRIAVDARCSNGLIGCDKLPPASAAAGISPLPKPLEIKAIEKACPEYWRSGIPNLLCVCAGCHAF
jgi:hypothetical protein